MKNIHRLFIATLSALFLLSACAETQLVAHAMKQMPHKEAKTKGYYKVGKPYKIRGERFHPKEQWEYEEVGYASWYGLEDHNKMTANGEIFNQYELLAAHRTLQLPSVVEVTNLENGRRIKVRVCDRGPFKDTHKRIIDLSMRAAELLDFKKQGGAKVRIKLLPEESKKAIAAIHNGYAQLLTQDLELAPTQHVDNRVMEVQVTPAQEEILPLDRATPLLQDEQALEALVIDNPYYIQLGAFSDPVRAQEFGASFANIGGVEVQPVTIPGQNGHAAKEMYRVKMGPFNQETIAKNKLIEVQANHPEALLLQSK